MTDTSINDDVTITCPADRDALLLARDDVRFLRLLLDTASADVSLAAIKHGYVCEQLSAIVDIIKAAIHDEIDPALYILTNEIENNEGR